MSSALESAFYEERTEALITEYLSCTGDSTPQSTEKLLNWKNGLNNFINSPQFPAIYKKFITATNMRQNVTPCDVMMWYHHHQKMIDLEIVRSSEAIKIHETNTNDARAIAEDLKARTPSPVDFHKIPFGVTASTFKALFAKEFPGALESSGTNFIARKIVWEGVSVSAVFHFSHDRFTRFELESPMLPSDSLDNTVRLIAQHLIEVITKKAGDPDRVFRVGFFDIIQDRLAPYATWKKRSFTVVVGLGTQKYRYFTRLIVSSTD